MARWAAFINRHHDPDAAWLTVDAGNYVDRAGTSGGCTNKCAFMITSYRDLHYDVLNLGRQEAWMGLATLEAIMDTTKKTDFVSANLIKVKNGKPVAKPYVIKDYGNMRVGILGLLNEADFPKSSSLLDSTQLRVDPAFDAARKYVPILKKKTDAVVLLCELPSAMIDSIAKSFPDIDVVISTGALRSGEAPTMVGKTHIVGPGSSGYSGHFATLEFNPAWKDSVGFTNFNDFLTDSYEEKGEWSEKLAAFNAMPVQASPTSPVKPNLSPTITPMNPSASPGVKPIPSTGSTPPTTATQGQTHG